MGSMRDRRPDWLNNEIKLRFAALQTERPPEYTFNGESSDYQFDELSCSALGLARSLERRNDRQLRILDIGAGAGGFVLECLARGHQAQGLSAHPYQNYPDFGRLTEQLPGRAYVLGDANRLDEVEGLVDKYDLIVSRHTFIHLADPLGALEQAVNRVSRGGLMAIKGVPIEGNVFYEKRELSPVTEELVLAGLTAGGFVVARSAYDPSLATSHEVGALYASRQGSYSDTCLAIDYEGDADSWRYKNAEQSPMRQLMHDCMQAAI